MLSCLGSGMMAGLFVAFSTFVMKSFASLTASEGMKAMQAINRFIIRPSFLVVFLGTAPALIASSYLTADMGTPHWLTLSATVIYLSCCIASTIAFNIPLNNRLDVAPTDQAAGHQIWREYVVYWTNWNHLRAAACVITTLLSAAALAYV